VLFACFVPAEEVEDTYSVDGCKAEGQDHKGYVLSLTETAP